MLTPAGSNACASACPTQRAIKLVLIPFGLGLVAGMGQAPWGLWFVTVAALAIWLNCPKSTRRAAFREGWLFGAGYFAVSLHWIVSPFLVDIGSTGWMAPFALILMAGGAALFWAAASYVARPHSMISAGLMILAQRLCAATYSPDFHGRCWVTSGSTHRWPNLQHSVDRIY